MADLAARDAVIRQAAFDRIRALQARDLVLDHEIIKQGFVFEGERWPLWNPQRGIFKPRGLPFLLSASGPSTPGTAPASGTTTSGESTARSSPARRCSTTLSWAPTPSAPDNVWLREAAERQVPVIYFLGVAPGRYQAIVPTFVVDWNASGLKARIAFGELAGATATATAPDLAERRYALRLVKQRLHQASFREGVLAAYNHRCAISNLPHDHLLDAAHIVADAHELLGQPVLANGLALSKIHHAAFDNHLIGIDRTAGCMSPSACWNSTTAPSSSRA